MTTPHEFPSSNSFFLSFFFFRGRGGGIGFHGSGGFADSQSNGYGPPQPAAGGYGGPPGGGGLGGSGGYRGDLKREGPSGYDDRDAKRPRY